MKIAIYHGFYNLHFEMLGYLFEYFQSNNILSEIDFYGYINIFSYEWWSFYNKHFNIKLNWIDPRLFNSKSNLYNSNDYIFLVTDDDYSFNNNSPPSHHSDIVKREQSNNNIKIISIEHIDYIRRVEVYERIGTRFFFNRPECNWALPCFNAMDKDNKINILKNENKINLIIIGQNQPKNINKLKDLFINFNDINFYLVVREIEYEYEKYDNVFIYEYCLTSILLELLKKCHYVLCYDINNNEHYAKKSISGSIPLCFSFGCKLILPSYWNYFYNFKSSITYNQNDNLILEKNINLNDIYDERNKLIQHRNNVFDKILFHKNINWYCK